MQQAPELSLPTNRPAEKAILSAAILYPHRLRECCGLVKPEHFAGENHRTIWTAILKIAEDADVTLHGLAAELVKTPVALSAAGGLSYLAELHDQRVPDVSTAIWTKPLIESYARRRLILKFNESLVSLSDQTQDIGEIAKDVDDEIRASLAANDPYSGFSSFADVIRAAGGMEAFLSDSHGVAASYPWPTLTKLTNGGIRPGQVVIIAGPSGKGKTALALNLVFHLARIADGVPLIFSLEMSKSEINKRLLSLASNVNSYRFHRLSRDEISAVRSGRQMLLDYPILTDESAGSIQSIRSQIHKIRSSQEVSCVVIDYVQLVEAAKVKGESREQEVSRVTRALKRMAMQFKIPIIALSQVNEEGHLRESRSILHNADLVLMLKFTRPYDIYSGIDTGDLDLVIEKQRSGPEGKFPLIFNAPTGHFFEP